MEPVIRTTWRLLTLSRHGSARFDFVVRRHMLPAICRLLGIGMTKLTKLRIFLTLGALAGIAPVTVAFIFGLPMLVSAVFYSPAAGWAATAILVSLTGLWGCWSAYRAAMASHPQPAHGWKLIAAVVVAIAWGVTLVAVLGGEPWVQIAFLMPGSTAAIMLGVARRRARLVGQGRLDAAPPC